MTSFLKPLFLPVSRLFYIKTVGGDEIHEIVIIYQWNNKHKRNEKAKILLTQYLQIIRTLYTLSPQI